jgi:apolipoprotein N-acyltransferase
VTLSNDSWLADGAGARLHFLVSIFRSIETRRPQIRATTTGISAVVTSAGDVVASAGVHERAGLVGSVAPVRGGVPLAARWGDWVGPAALLVFVGLLVWPRPPSRA